MTKISKNKRWNDFCIGDEVVFNGDKKLWTDLPGGSGIIKSFHNRCYAEVVWNKTGTSTIIDARTWYSHPGSMRQCKIRHVESCLCGKCIDWEDSECNCESDFYLDIDELGW